MESTNSTRLLRRLVHDFSRTLPGDVLQIVPTWLQHWPCQRRCFFFLSGLVFEFDIGIVDWKDGSWLNNYFPANITLLSRLDFCFMSFFPVKHAHVSHDTGQNCVCVCVRVTQWWSRHELLIQLTFQIFLSKVNNEVEAVVTLSATWSIKGATLWKYSHLIHYSVIWVWHMYVIVRSKQSCQFSAHIGILANGSRYGVFLLF